MAPSNNSKSSNNKSGGAYIYLATLDGSGKTNVDKSFDTKHAHLKRRGLNPTP
jgi:adenylylsulfate kinase-like enzyme